MSVLACLHGDWTLAVPHFRNCEPPACVEGTGSHRNLDRLIEMRTPQDPQHRTLLTQALLPVVAAWRHRRYRSLIEEAPVSLEGPRNHLADASRSSLSKASILEA